VSDVNSIVTRGFDYNQKVVTRGFGGTLVIVVDDTKPILFDIAGIPTGLYPITAFEPLIETRTIRLPAEETDITVDVLLLCIDDVPLAVRAALESKRYKEIRVVLKNGVEFHD